MNIKSYLPFIIIFAILAGGLFLAVKTNIISLHPVSPDILYLTTPINGFTGTIEKIEASSITLSRKVSITTNYLATAPNPPQSKTAILRYKAKITPKTPILSLVSLSGASPSATPNLTIKDLKIGQVVNVGSSKDLRTIIQRQLEATNIVLTYYSLGGKVTDIKGNIIMVKGNDINHSLEGNVIFDPKDYSVEVNSPDANKIKVGSEVIIYHDLPADAKSQIKAISVSIQTATLNSASSSANPSKTFLVPTPPQ